MQQPQPDQAQPQMQPQVQPQVQPQIQPQIQPQMQPQIQYASPHYHQLQPQMMLCPLQYVYEQQLMPSPDEQVQQTPQTFQNQAFLMNVQNTPPWIQNRTNMVYMPQMMPNNIQPYIQQHVVQTPVYNYQYQPMIMQEQIRHVVPNYINPNVIQNPQMVQNLIQNQQMAQNVIQNQQMAQNVIQNSQIVQNVIQNQNLSQPNVINTQVQNPVRFQMEHKRESPLLTQILQNVRKTTPQQNEFVQRMVIRPQYTNARPQMIIVNQVNNHTCTRNNKEPIVTIQQQQPQIIQQQMQQQQQQQIIQQQTQQQQQQQIVQQQTQQQQQQQIIQQQTQQQQQQQIIQQQTQQQQPQKSEVPQNIRSQIPEGLSVKTVFKLPATALVKPTELTLQNIAPADEAHPRVYPKPVVKPVSNRDPQTNYKRKIREIMEQNTKDESEIQAFKRNCQVNRQEAANKHTKIKIYVDLPIPTNLEAQITPNTPGPIESDRFRQNGVDSPQVEEKLLRNTVFVQARGRINEMLINDIQNTSVGNPSVSNPSASNQSLSTQSASNQSASIENLSNQSLENNANIMPNVNIQDNTEMNVNVIQNNVIKKEIPKLNPIETEKKLLVSVANEKEPPVEEKNPVQEKKETCSIESNKQNVKLIQILHSNDGGSAMIQNSSKINEDVPSNDADHTKAKNITNLNENTISNTSNETKTQNEPKSSETLLLEDEIGAENNTITKKLQSDGADGNVSKNVSEITDTLLSKRNDDKKSRNNSKMTQILLSDNADGIRNDSKMTKISPSKDSKTIIRNKRKTVLDINSKDAKTRKNTKMAKTDKLKKAKKEKMANTAINWREPVEKYVLTHVLDGHIIQESNVPFVVQKMSIISPLKEKTNQIDDTNLAHSKKTDYYNRIDDENSSIEAETSSDKDIDVSIDIKENEREPSIEEKENEREVSTEDNLRETATENNKSESNVTPELAKANETVSIANEDDPLANLSKDTVKSWSVSDLSSHLMNYQDWQQSARKLREEEIDGESLLLVNKEQLIQIGICEEHAQVLSDFIESVQ